jgi:TonB family protein
MKGPSLQKTAAVSAALHVTVFLISVLLLKQTNHFTIPSPYMVDLVGQDIRTHSRGQAGAASARSAVKHPDSAEENVQKSEKISKKEEQRVEDTIAALTAKRNIREIVALREKLLSIKASGRPTEKGPLKSPVVGSSQGTRGSVSYEDRIRDEIHRQWFCPDTGSRDLEAIISLTIRKDGSLANIEMEKKSGSRIFNNCALQAIAKASPVTPPPTGEMTIGIRFYP